MQKLAIVLSGLTMITILNFQKFHKVNYLDRIESGAMEDDVNRIHSTRTGQMGEINHVRAKRSMAILKRMLACSRNHLSCKAMPRR